MISIKLRICKEHSCKTGIDKIVIKYLCIGILNSYNKIVCCLETWMELDNMLSEIGEGQILDDFTQMTANSWPLITILRI